MEIHTASSTDVLRLLPLIEEEYKELRELRTDLILDPTKRFDSQSLKVYLSDPKHICYCVESDGELVAFCLAKEVENENIRLNGPKPHLVLEDIFVKKENRHRHIGEALVRNLLVKADELHCQDFSVTVRAEYSSSRTFFEHLGLLPLSIVYGIEI